MKRIPWIAGFTLIFSALLGACDLITGSPPGAGTATPGSQGDVPSPGGGAQTEVPGVGESSGPEAVPTDDPFKDLFFHQGWARVPASITVFGGYGADEMTDVAAGGPGVVAVGYASRAGELDAVVWYSSDGLRWARVEDAGIFGGQGVQYMKAVAAGARGVVAVGWEQGGDLDAAVWYSADGMDWRRITSGSFGGAGDQGINAVIANDSGFVAVGWEETTEEIRGAVWTSGNGVTWERVPHSEAAFGGLGSFVVLEAVTQVGSAVLATGSIESVTEYDVDTGIWASNDGGKTWVRLNNSDQVLGDSDSIRFQLVSGVTYGNSLFVMAGTEHNTPGSLSGDYVNGVIWTSLDGVNWQRVYDHKPEFYAQNMLSVTASPFGFWVGGYEVVSDQSQAAFWFSADGITWEQVQYSERVFGGNGLQAVNGIVAAGPGLIAVGASHATGDVDAAVWIYVPGR